MTGESGRLEPFVAAMLPSGSIRRTRYMAERVPVTRRQWSGEVDLRKFEPGMLLADLAGDVHRVIPPEWPDEFAATLTIDLVQGYSANDVPFTIDFSGQDIYTSYGVPISAPATSGSRMIIHMMWTGDVWWVYPGSGDGQVISEPLNDRVQ